MQRLSAAPGPAGRWAGPLRGPSRGSLAVVGVGAGVAVVADHPDDAARIWHLSTMSTSGVPASSKGGG